MSQINVTKINHESGAGDNIILSADGDTQINSLNGSALGGFRNQLINGDFRVWQRGTSVVYGSANGGYTADRWAGASDTTTSQRVKYGNIPVAEVLGNKYMLQGVELYIDPFSNTVNTQFVVGSTWTLSYYATKAPDGAISNIAEFRDAATNGTSSTNPVVIATISTPTATGKTLGSGNELVQYSTTFTVTGTPAATNRSAVFHITGNSNDVDFAYAQLEPGSVATPFEHRPMATELAMCQRYYWTSTSGNSLDGSANTASNNMLTPQTPNTSSGVFEAARVPFPVVMRSQPTCTYLSTSGASNKLYVHPVGDADVRFSKPQTNFVSVTTFGAGTYITGIVITDAEL